VTRYACVNGTNTLDFFNVIENIKTWIVMINFCDKLNKLRGILIVIFLIACSAVNLGAEVRPVGKLLFKSESGSEVMIYSSSGNPSAIISRGNLLLVGKEPGAVRVTVSDISGLYIRCSVDKDARTAVNSLREGTEVYFSDEINASAKYGDLKKVLNALILLYENFIYSVESVDEPASLAASVNRFAGKLESLIPEMARLNSKYPELKNFNISPPPELQYESDTLGLLEPRLRDAFYKIRLYSGDNGDENVKKAVANLQRVLDKMKTGK